jgi:DNA-binding response OmpR family regulator
MTRRAAVLVVEDDPSLRTTMCAVLALKNFSPLAADTVEAALKILGVEHVDAMVLDVRLPDPTGVHTSGLTLLKFLRATTDYASLPVLIFTGMPLSPSELELVRASGAHVFYKPQSYSVLFELLGGLLHPPGATPSPETA